MPMNAQNQRHFHRMTFAGMLEPICLYKRGDDQREGTVTPKKLYQCRRGKIRKTGQSLQGDMSSEHQATWHIPRTELDRQGITYINNLDRIVDKKLRVWQPEATTDIEVKLFEVHVDVHCLRVDPPDLYLQQFPV